jgi:hypothetical protein
VAILLLKLLLAPSLVVASTLAGRRWGPDVAGILVALPIVAAPILFITYQQHGARFASDAANPLCSGWWPSPRSRWCSRVRRVGSDGRPPWP